MRDVKGSKRASARISAENERMQMTKDMGNTEVLHVSTLGSAGGLTFSALETSWDLNPEDLLSRGLCLGKLKQKISTSPWDLLGYVSEC